MSIENNGVSRGSSSARPAPRMSSRGLPRANDRASGVVQSAAKGCGGMSIAKEGLQHSHLATAVADSPRQRSGSSTSWKRSDDAAGEETRVHQETVHSPSGSRSEDPCDTRKKGGDHCAGVVARPRLFAGILPADYTEICRAARPKEFARGDMLHLEGDPVKRVLLVTSGSVKFTKMNRAGSEVILRLGMPGDFLGTEVLLGCGKHYATAQVFRTCRTLVWDVQAFQNLVGRYSVVRQNMVAILEGHLRELEDRFREAATERVGSRVAFQLLRLLKAIGQPVGAGVEIGLSREDMAQMTGTTLFTVSRLLSAWEERGVVKPRRNAVVICDVESLCGICGQESPEESRDE